MATPEVRPPPPGRLSQDSNMNSRNFTEGMGRLRYIPDVQEEPCLACRGALALHLRNHRWLPLTQLRRCGELLRIRI
jgi:hypothetical protein